jgi:hypothetical protein
MSFGVGQDCVRGRTNINGQGAVMMRVTNNGRLLGFDAGDWSMLIVGFTLAGLLVLIV